MAASKNYERVQGIFFFLKEKVPFQKVNLLCQHVELATSQIVGLNIFVVYVQSCWYTKNPRVI